MNISIDLPASRYYVAKTCRLLAFRLVGGGILYEAKATCGLVFLSSNSASKTDVQRKNRPTQVLPALHAHEKVTYLSNGRLESTPIRILLQTRRPASCWGLALQTPHRHVSLKGTKPAECGYHASVQKVICSVKI